MHPVIIEAIAAERTADMQARAAGARRVHQIRRSAQAGPSWRPGRLVRALRSRPAPRPLRDPRAA